VNHWWVYIIEKKNKFYVGITTDISNRLRQHGHPPLLYKECLISRDQAVAREKKIKGWSHKKKLELITKASSQQR